MKFSFAALCVVLMTSVEGFVHPSTTTPRLPSVQLEAHKQHKQSIGSAFGVALVGWSLATQMAFAGVMAPDNQGKQTMWLTSDLVALGLFLCTETSLT